MFDFIVNGLVNSPSIQLLWTIGVEFVLGLCLTGMAISHHENK